MSNSVRQGRGLCLGRAGRKALESPFLVRDSLQSSIAVCDQRLLPAFLRCLPLGPGFCGIVDDAVRKAGWFGGLLRGFLAVDQGLTSRQREEKDAHLGGKMVVSFVGVGGLHVGAVCGSRAISWLKERMVSSGSLWMSTGE